MGGTVYTADAWKSYASASSAKPIFTTFTSTRVHPDLDPKEVYRESRDSAIHPKSRLLVLCPDLTGSMGFLSKALVDKDLGETFEQVISRSKAGELFSDPHVMVMGLGDVEAGDQGPLQVTQAEADPVTLATQCEKIWIEGHGGGNMFESYHLPWYFAATHISMDCWDKRGKKGYLFTIGDEPPPHTLYAKHIEQVIGTKQSTDLSIAEVLDMASQKFEVFHIIIGEGQHARSRPDDVRNAWQLVLGQRALWLSDHTKLAELVVSTIQINEGIDKDEVIKSWDGDTAVVIASATKNMMKTPTTSGVVRF